MEAADDSQARCQRRQNGNNHRLCLGKRANMDVITVQEDGRIELPSPVRERLGLRPGAQLGLEELADGRTVQLQVLSEQVALVEKDGVWVISRKGHAPATIG